MTKRARKPIRIVTKLDTVVGGVDDSRNIEFEMIKNEIQKLAQMQQ